MEEMLKAIGRLEGVCTHLEKSVDLLSEKVDDLMAAKNKGMGFLASIGLLAGALGALIKTAINELIP